MKLPIALTLLCLVLATEAGKGTKAPAIKTTGAPAVKPAPDSVAEEAMYDVAASKRNYISKKYGMQVLYLKQELAKEEARHKIKQNEIIDIFMKF